MKTRTAEWLISWVLVSWGSGVFLSYQLYGEGGGMTRFLATIGPVDVIAALVVGFAAARMIALLYNGHWRRSPLLRMAAAVIGMMFWQAVLVLFGLAMIRGDAMFFPMFLSAPVFLFFEGYSAYRCGEDAAKAHSFRFACLIWAREKIISAFGANNRSGTNVVT